VRRRVPDLMDRTTFLSAAAGGFAAGALGVPSRAASASGPISYAAFLAQARTSFKHKQLFTSPRVNNGAIFGYMRNSLNGYQFGWAEGPGSLHAVAVLNGVGVAQGLNDAAWTTYRLGSVLAQHGDAVKTAGTERGNPWLHAAAAYPRDDADPTAPYNMDATIETLQRRGATIFVCDNALRLLAVRAIEAGFGGGASLEGLHDDLRAKLVPASLLVPAGVTTIDALQQEHFTLYDASI
jgi:intracellular sulfur oxidation DsrE/DsrF family protein